MGDVNKMLEEQQRELERVRAKKKRGGFGKERVRMVLNIIFLVLAVVGFALYFTHAYRETGLLLIVVGMVVKVIEFLVRFLG